MAFLKTGAGKPQLLSNIRLWSVHTQQRNTNTKVICKTRACLRVRRHRSRVPRDCTPRRNRLAGRRHIATTERDRACPGRKKSGDRGKSSERRKIERPRRQPVPQADTPRRAVYLPRISQPHIRRFSASATRFGSGEQ